MLTLDQLLTIRPLLEVLLQAVIVLLTLKFQLLGLEGPAQGTSTKAACVATFNSRSSVCVEQDVSVLQILGLWSHLQVFLEGIAALEG